MPHSMTARENNIINEKKIFQKKMEKFAEEMYELQTELMSMNTEELNNFYEKSKNNSTISSKKNFNSFKTY